jgi:hypothetical protein
MRRRLLACLLFCPVPAFAQPAPCELLQQLDVAAAFSISAAPEPLGATGCRVRQEAASLTLTLQAGNAADLQGWLDTVRQVSASQPDARVNRETRVGAQAFWVMKPDEQQLIASKPGWALHLSLSSANPPPESLAQLRRLAQRALELLP